VITKKSWEEFRETGLLLIVNQFLHIFGWAIVFDFEKDEHGQIKELKEVYPARVTFRGFSNKSTEANYKKVSQYMKDNAEELLKEALED
jgi:hypothetical protein